MDFAPAALYFILYIFVYIQIFWLVTFFENRRKLTPSPAAASEGDLLSVSVIIPCYNEEKTVARTIRSVLDLDYPRDKISIIAVDDGSTDGTYEEASRFAGLRGVLVFRKENGGKFTALNLGLAHAKTDLVACLDADSVVHPQAMRRIAFSFRDPRTMAVAPAIIVEKPRNFIQMAQKIEYSAFLFVKKMTGFLGGIYVTPGPFSVYRREVFDKIGGFCRAHQSEDLEIAFRMQKNFMKIEQSHDAYSYTIAPESMRKLFRQRLRWTYGFINNAWDYRKLLFRKKYGNFSILSVPAALFGIGALTTLFFMRIYDLLELFSDKLLAWRSAGWQGVSPALDWYFVDTRAISFIAGISIFIFLVIVSLGVKMAEGRARLPWQTVYFVLIALLVSPFWIMKAVWNTIFRQVPRWN